MGSAFQARKEAHKRNEGFCCEYQVYIHFKVTTMAILKGVAGDEAEELNDVPFFIIMSLLIFFFFFLLFRATPAAYGRSLAKSQIRAAAIGLHHSHGNVRSKPHL